MKARLLRCMDGYSTLNLGVFDEQKVTTYPYFCRANRAPTGSGHPFWGTSDAASASSASAKAPSTSFAYWS